MQVLSPQAAVTRKPECAEPLAPLVTRDIERDPPERAPDGRWNPAETQRLAVEAHLFQLFILVPLGPLLDLGQALGIRGAEKAHQHAVLALEIALDRERAIHPGVLVNPRPRE